MPGLPAALCPVLTERAEGAGGAVVGSRVKQRNPWDICFKVSLVLCSEDSS